MRYTFKGNRKIRYRVSSLELTVPSLQRTRLVHLVPGWIIVLSKYFFHSLYRILWRNLHHPIWLLMSNSKGKCLAYRRIPIPNNRIDICKPSRRHYLAEDFRGSIDAVNSPKLVLDSIVHYPFMREYVSIELGAPSSWMFAVFMTAQLWSWWGLG